MYGLSMEVTFWVGVFVAVEIRHEFAFVGQGLLERARALRKFVGVVFQISVVFEPLVAKIFWPIITILPLPLRSKVPSQRNRSTPNQRCNFNLSLSIIVLNRYRLGQINLNESKLYVVQKLVVSISIVGRNNFVRPCVLHVRCQVRNVQEFRSDCGFSVAPKRYADVGVFV